MPYEKNACCYVCPLYVLCMSYVCPMYVLGMSMSYVCPIIYDYAL